MQDFIYHGCVSAVSAPNSGLPDVLLPNATVTADPDHPYVKRLVARKLLTATEVVIPTAPTTPVTAPTPNLMEWLTVTAPSITPNQTVPPWVANGATQIYQTIDTDCNLQAVGQDMTNFTLFEAFYKLQDGDKIRIEVPNNTYGEIRINSTDYYGYNIEGVAGNDNRTLLATMQVSNTGNIYGQVRDANGNNQPVNSVNQEFIDLEYHANDSSYLTFLDGVKTEVFLFYTNFKISVFAMKDIQGNAVPLPTLKITRL